MAELAKEKVEIRDFPGLASDLDPQDIGPGAAEEQVNVTSDVTGELNVRLGYRQLSFEAGG